MQKIFVRIGIFAVMIFLFTATGSAGPFDQLKNLKIDPKAIMQPKQNAVEFQFTNFKLNPDSGDASRTWNVDLKITQAIAANTYRVKTVFQNRAGETLFSGEDIVLPAGNAGKTFQLTRPFQKEPPAVRMIFQVYNRAENRMVASQRYPLSAISSYGLQGAATSSSAKPAAPQRVPAGSSAKPDMDFKVDFAADRDSRQIQIQNNNSFPVKIDEIAGKARFLAGVDQEINVDCKHKKTIQPGESVICYFDHVAYCPTLYRIDLDAKINGNTYHEEINYDAPIKEITKEQLVSLERLSKIPQYRDLDWPGATAKIIIRGLYVRIGTSVTIKALASLDSDRFPVVFRGVQKDDGIHAEITFSGTKTSKPEKFCFNIMEITTYDDLRCGGVGVLIYRNDFVYDGVNIFLHKKECK